MKKPIILALTVFFLLIAIIMANGSSNNNTGITSVSASEFSSEVQEEGAVILDIRTSQEYNTGRIAGAVNIDYYRSDFKNQLEKLDRNQAYKLYCNSGNRSGGALKIMQEMGFTNVVELNGGIQSWISAKLPACTNC